MSRNFDLLAQIEMKSGSPDQAGISQPPRDNGIGSPQGWQHYPK